MHVVVGIFDAPIPARIALDGLHDAGFAARDIAVLPELFASPALRLDGPDGPLGTFQRQDPNAPDALAAHLRSYGLAPDEAAVIAEAVRRGAILILVRAPTLSAPVAADLIARAGPADLAAEAMRWQAQPDWRYGWNDADAPPMD